MWSAKGISCAKPFVIKKVTAAGDVDIYGYCITGCGRLAVGRVGNFGMSGDM